MKYILPFSLVCWLVLPVSAQNDFEDGFTGLKFQNEKKLFDYAFQNTDLATKTTGLLLDYCEYPDSTWSVLSTISSHPIANSAFCYQVAGIVNQIGLSEEYNDDDLIYPFLEHISSLDYVKKARIPFLVYDLEISQTNAATRATIESWNSTAPFPSFSENDFIQKDFFFAATMTDSIPYTNAVIHFDPSKIRSNKNRILETIVIEVGGVSYYLLPNDELDLSNFGGTNTINITYQFNDSTEVSTTQEIMLNTNVALPKSGFWDFTNTHNQTALDLQGNFYDSPASEYVGNITNPYLRFSIKYGCEEGIIKKPYFLVAGWGPHTDIGNINYALGWATPMYDIAQSMNQAGFIENLHDAGYDVILVQFFPPNAAIQYNSQLLEMLINHINQLKYANDSYEENIIHGVSAGALCIKYTLVKMEQKHLEQNGPHPHTKLFVSFDGEHLGANIPLGLQHQVIFMDLYRHSNNIVWFGNIGISPGASMYALRYILDAPLSRQLLYYFYSESGTTSNPGQGNHIMRDWYLNEQSSFNHALNNHIPSYPSFGRNISISNGSSTPDYNFSNYSANHFPYPSETNATIFYDLDIFRKYESHFLTHGINRPFYYGKKYGLWFQHWMVKYEAVTKNPLILDNAPGGIIFIEGNPLVAGNDLMKFVIHPIGQPDEMNNHLFAFTPTVLTHDIKNYNSFSAGHYGYMNYNFKTNKLNYDNEFDAEPTVDLPSNTIGYPHLGYPSNHYSITPFDALFTWDRNTVHVTSGEKALNHYEEIFSFARDYMKNFIVEEGEHWNVFLQNKRIGHYARPGYTYRVDYNADNEIWWGEHVTQKTDFLPVEIEANAIVRAFACEGHVIMPGFEIKPGADVHIAIGCEECSINNGNKMATTSEGSNEVNSPLSIDESKVENRAISLIPNPAMNLLRIDLPNTNENDAFNFFIYDFSGTLVHSGSGDERTKIELELAKGMYIVKVKTENEWYTEKLIIN